MANSLATTNGTLIARRILDVLLDEFPALRLFTNDFSSETALWGQPIKVQTPGILTAGDYSTTNGYVASDVTQTEVTLTINKHKHSTFSFDDQERTSTSTNLIERFARNGAYALGSAMMSDLFALVVTANFSQATVVAAGSLNRTAIVALSKRFNTRKVPSIGRFLIVNDNYLETLLNDTSLVSNAGSPSDAVRSGQLGNVHGFNVQLYSALPTNAQSLAGFAGTSDGIVIATRVPQVPEDMNEVPGRIETVTEEKTGLSLQVRTWYDMKLGKEFRTYTLMYGVAVGNSTCVERLTTA